MNPDPPVTKARMGQPYGRIADIRSVSTQGTAPAAPQTPEGAPALRRIGDIIVDHDFASREAVERAVVEARETGRTTGQTLLEGGVVTPDQLARAVAERYGIDHVDLNDYPIDKGATSLVDPAVLRKHRTVPIAFLDDKVMLVATADPANVLAIDDLSMMTGYEIRRAVATEEDVDALLGRLGRLDAAVEEIEEGRKRHPSSSCASPPRTRRS